MAAAAAATRIARDALVLVLRNHIDRLRVIRLADGALAGGEAARGAGSFSASSIALVVLSTRWATATNGMSDGEDTCACASFGGCRQLC